MLVDWVVVEEVFIGWGGSSGIVELAHFPCE